MFTSFVFKIGFVASWTLRSHLTSRLKNFTLLYFHSLLTILVRMRWLFAYSTERLLTIYTSKILPLTRCMDFLCQTSFWKWAFNDVLIAQGHKYAVFCECFLINNIMNYLSANRMASITYAAY